jgi:Flp pilus assembly protein TadB
MKEVRRKFALSLILFALAVWGLATHYPHQWLKAVGIVFALWTCLVLFSAAYIKRQKIRAIQSLREFVDTLGRFTAHTDDHTPVANSAHSDIPQAG